jgi:Lrp/AsnC family transcriptional regulator, leucine-responsive regulatory protein
MKSEHALDAMDWKLLDELQRDARLSLSELGRRVGLSTPAVKERVARMEEQGVIAGYQAQVDPRRAGYGVLAFVRMTVAGDERVARRLVAEAGEMPEVLECHRATGDHAFILKVVAASVEALEKLIDRLTAYGMTSTSVVLSSPLSRSVLFRPPEAQNKPK